MMSSFEVVYNPSIKVSNESFTLNPSSSDCIICDLKRKIFKSQGIPPTNQRLSLEGNTDNFNIPTRIICKIRTNRNANTIITISGFNQDTYSFRIDPNDDNILDLKFALAQKINEEPEYIRLSINNEAMPNNDIKLKTLTLSNSNRFWFEYPSKTIGHGSIHRTVTKLMDIDPEWPTIGHSLRKLGRQQPNDRHLGTRKVIGTNGKKGEYEWITFKELNDRVSALSAGFCSLGLKAKETRMGICAGNRVEWLLADYAAQCQSFITVPLYDTLAKNAIEYIINHATCQLVICTKETLPQIIKVLPKCPSLQYIVLCDDARDDKEWIAQHPNAGFTHTISELEQIGMSKPCKDVLPSPDDLATICYTSGTTGNPKGVMLTHRNLMSAINAFWQRLPQKFLDGNEDSVLSYLPLAHIYERGVELFCLRAGARIGYFGGSTDTLLDDIQALEPSIFVGVPRVFQKVQDKTFAEVGKSNFIRRFLFDKAYNAKQYAIDHGLPSPSFWQKVVLKKVKAKFGGRMKACLSGSAPLSVSTANFMKICLSDLIGEGYGLTETAATGTSTDLEDVSFGHVGTPTPTVEIKLVDVEDMNYRVSDKPNPRGEIWIRGTSVFKGYYRNAAKTKEVLSNDGWFATGDVGMWEKGKLKIIDRKKNIFKLAQGEYIRPEYIENVYKMSPYVTNVFVYGDSSNTFLVGIVVPDFEVITEWAKANGLSEIAEDYKALCANAKVVNLIRLSMENVAKQEELIGFEKVKRFKLYEEDFSVDNGLLTATMKLKRHAAKLYFKQSIDRLYQQVAASKL